MRPETVVLALHLSQGVRIPTAGQKAVDEHQMPEPHRGIIQRHHNPRSKSKQQKNVAAVKHKNNNIKTY